MPDTALSHNGRLFVKNQFNCYLPFQILFHGYTFSAYTTGAFETVDDLIVVVASGAVTCAAGQARIGWTRIVFVHRIDCGRIGKVSPALCGHFLVVVVFGFGCWRIRLKEEMTGGRFTIRLAVRMPWLAICRQFGQDGDQRTDGRLTSALVPMAGWRHRMATTWKTFRLTCPFLESPFSTRLTAPLDLITVGWTLFYWNKMTAVYFLIFIQI